jgi:hypothetical protein
VWRPSRHPVPRPVQTVLPTAFGMNLNSGLEQQTGVFELVSLLVTGIGVLVAVVLVTMLYCVM